MCPCAISTAVIFKISNPFSTLAKPITRDNMLKIGHGLWKFNRPSHNCHKWTIKQHPSVGLRLSFNSGQRLHWQLQKQLCALVVLVLECIWMTSAYSDARWRWQIIPKENTQHCCFFCLFHVPIYEILIVAHSKCVAKCLLVGRWPSQQDPSNLLSFHLVWTAK